MPRTRYNTSDEDLRGHLAGGKLEPYLRHIRFPRYRNLVNGTSIEFDFPITAIVGPNGTNKTSVLRAIQGCPDYENLGNYWFGTPLDPISGKDRPRFIHGWRADSTGEVVESVKQREPSGKEDYFEPARPRDHMAQMVEGVGDLNTGRGSANRRERSETRWNAINKEVVYIDFRSELSAFDKYFHHNSYRRRRKDPSTLPDQRRSKKNLIRERAASLKRAIDGRLTSNKLGSIERILTVTMDFDEDQIGFVSDILGRQYTRIRLIEHGFFDVSGWTALLGSNGAQYSEAWAGSGEFAVVQMVRLLTTCEDSSLVILDEPEVSLHPAAQKRLADLLRLVVVQKSLQIVMSTHSPTLIEQLPPEAIKVLQLRSDGQVELRSQRSHPNEAFVVLGQSFSKPTIYVEDRLAAAVTTYALRMRNSTLAESVDVRVYPGGARSITTRAVATWSVGGTEKVLVMLDGDMKPTDTRTGRAVPDADLDGYLKALAGGKPRIDRPSGVVDESHKRAYVSWWEHNVRFLPGDDNPESLLLDLVGMSPATGDDAKLLWKDKTAEAVPTEVDSEAIYQEQIRALNGVHSDDPRLIAIAETVQTWLDELTP